MSNNFEQRIWETFDGEDIYDELYHEDDISDEVEEDDFSISSEIDQIEWVEEFEGKKFDDILDYLEAKRKIINGTTSITEIHIKVNTYDPNLYDFEWR